MKDYFVRISYNSDTDIWEEIDEELNLELNEISKAPLALYKKAKFLETENLRYKTQIESGELCDREEVRKETAEKILKPLYNVIMEHPDCCVNLSEDIKFLMEKYGIDLENEE